MRYNNSERSTASKVATAASLTFNAIENRFAPSYAEDIKLKDKSFSYWLSEGSGTIETMRSTWLYQVISDDYKKNLKSLYHDNAKGCCKDYIRRYKFTADEFDTRMVDAVTASVSFVCSVSNYFATYNKAGLRCTTLLQQLSIYNDEHCSGKMQRAAVINLHWWYQSWVFDFMMAVSSAVALNNDESSTNIAADTEVALAEIFVQTFAIAFEHPEEIPFIFYVGNFYTDAIQLTGFLAHTIPYATYLALTHRKVLSPTRYYASADDWLQEVAKHPYADTAFNFINMPKFCKKLPSLYKKLFKPTTKLHLLMQHCAMIYPVKSFYNMFMFGEEPELAATYKTIEAVSHFFDPIRAYTHELEITSDEWSDYLLAQAADDSERAQLKRFSRGDTFAYWYYSLGALHTCRQSTNLWKTLDTCALRETVVGLRLTCASYWKDTYLNKSYKRELDITKSSLESLSKSNKRTQQKLEELRKQNKKLEEQVSVYKSKANKAEASKDLEGKLALAQAEIQKIKSTNVSLTKHIESLESKEDTVEFLKSKIAKLQQRLDIEEQFNKELCEEVVDDTKELTDEELSLLHTMKAHLVVPTMAGIQELQRYMPKSEFLYTTNDSDYRLRVSTSCDLFFFCIKFASHGKYWQWKSQLLHVPERCVELYSVNKNNIARALIKRYKELNLQ